MPYNSFKQLSRFWYFRQSFRADPAHLALCVKINKQVYLQILKTRPSLSILGGRAAPGAHPWHHDPLRALLPRFPTSQWAYCHRTEHEVKHSEGSGVEGWGDDVTAVTGGWLGESGGGLSRGSQSHTGVTVLCSKPVGIQCGTELPLMALNSAWWLALF